jgi:hypothetical protein
MYSLCQFWNDSNQNRDVPIYLRTESDCPPWARVSALYSEAPPAAWRNSDAKNSANRAIVSECS